MSEWLEHSVQIEVAAPIEHVWNLWQNIELMPRYVFNTGMGSAQARTALSITFGANIYFSKSKAREISKEM